MREKRFSYHTWAVLSFVALPALFSSTVSADRFDSTNFTIDAGITGGSLAGEQSSTSYKLTSSGGESVIGNAAGGSYKLGEGYVAQLENAIELNVQPNGLVAYYSFDNSLNKTIFDEGPNNLNAEVLGSPTQGTGKLGQAIQTGQNNSAQTTTTTGLDNGNVTVMAWLKATDWTTEINGIAVGRWATSVLAGSYHIGMNGASQFRFGINQDGTSTNIASSTSTAGVWYHVTGTYDGTTMRLYRNGIEQNTSTAESGALPSLATPLSIGERSNQGDPYWNGAVDEAKVFNRALSAEEVLAEYNAQNAGTVTGLALGSLLPNISRTSSFDVITQADTPGYTLAINQNNDLTSGGNTIPAVSGSIASPLTWSEGTTKGLGFTMYGTNATSIPGSWSSGAAYAALPGSATSFYTRTGFTAGAKDVLNMRYRVDITGSQAIGDYSNLVTITGTTTP